MATELVNRTTPTKLAGYTAIGGAISMIIGAALWGSTGTDLWQTLDGGDMAAYLQAVAEVKPQLIANTSFWVLGVLLMGMAGTTLADFSPQRPGLNQAIRLCFYTAVPLAIVAFFTMLAITLQLAPDTSPATVATAKVLGWIGARADDLATVLIIGAGPLLISLAGRGDWVPSWLLRWGYLAGICGLLSIVFLYLPGMGQYGFIILPFGMGWLIAAGIVLLRK